MNADRPSSSTYVRPLDEGDPGITVLCVVPRESDAGGVADDLAASVESIDALRATTSSGALDLLEAKGVDCVVNALPLSDADTNGADATGALAFLEELQENHADLPVVVLANDGSERAAAEVVNAGAEGYVPHEGTPEEGTIESLADRIGTVVEEYRSTEQYEEAARLLFRLTEYTTDTLWMFTGDWSETVVINQAYEDVWDRSNADLIEDPTDFLEGIHPDDRSMVREKMDVLAGGEPADLEYRIETEGGERWVSVHAEPVVDDGEVEYVAGFTRDVTELKRREERIKEVTEATRGLPHARSEEEVAHLLVDIVDGIIGCPITAYWSYDEDRDVHDPEVASDGALEIAGVDGPDDLPTIDADDDEMAAFREGDSRLIEEYGGLASPSHPDSDLGTLLLIPLGDHGTLNVGALDANGLDDFDRHLAEILGRAATDALDRVEREQRLQRQHEELERSNENLQQFAYVASHDLQEPLRMVSSYVSLLDDEYGDQFDGEAREYMDFAVDGATRMQEMIDALLEYSRVHTEGEEFDEVDAGAVLEETRKSLELRLEEENATVERGDLPAVAADRSQLGQIFQNLIKNAAEHAGEAPTIRVDGWREDDHVHLSVADDGDGIEPDQQEKVFEIFEGDSDGTGIGLAMCERIVTRHGGDIWVESTPGEGATFHFTVPSADGADGESPASHPVTIDGGHP